MTNFANVLAAGARDASDRPAVRLDDQTLTYRELDQAVAHTAGLLRAHGVEPGDRVGMQLPNLPYFPIVYWAGLRIGAVIVPMNPLLKGGEVAYHLSDAGARVMLGLGRFRGGGTRGFRLGARRVHHRRAGRVRSIDRRRRHRRRGRRPR